MRRSLCDRLRGRGRGLNWLRGGLNDPLDHAGLRRGRLRRDGLLRGLGLFGLMFGLRVGAFAALRLSDALEHRPGLAVLRRRRVESAISDVRLQFTDKGADVAHNRCLSVVLRSYSAVWVNTTQSQMAELRS